MSGWRIRNREGHGRNWYYLSICTKVTGMFTNKKSVSLDIGGLRTRNRTSDISDRMQKYSLFSQNLQIRHEARKGAGEFALSTFGDNSFKYNQQDATLYNILYYRQCSTCFRRFLRPSSGAQKLPTASGICQACLLLPLAVAASKLDMMGGETAWNM